MDVNMFSLEDDDDYGDIFIIQTPSNVDNDNTKEDLNDSIDMFDFASPVVHESEMCNTHYSDISDPEDNFANPIYGHTEG